VKASFAGSKDAIDNRGALRRRRSVLLILAITAISVLVLGVSAVSAVAPTVTMGTATNPGFTTVDVTGEVNPQGEPTEYFYEVSTDGTNWERKNLSNFSSESTPQPFPGTIEGLKPETAYRVRLSAFNYAEESAGPVSSPPSSQFTTLGPVPKPTVTIDPVSTFTATTAHFSGKINPGGAQSDPGFKVHWHFVCEPDCLNLSSGSGEFADDGIEHTVQTDASIEPNTSYTIKLIAGNVGGDETAQTAFQSSKEGPAVTTLPAFAIQGGTKALLGGTVNPRNDATTYWVEYGPTTTYGQKFPLAPAGAGSGGKAEYETEEVTGLTPSSVYHFRLAAENSDGPSNGADMNFETAPAGPLPSQSCPNAALRAENNSEELPECRAYEQVSPLDKNGYDAAYGMDFGSPLYVAAEDGSAVTFESYGGFGDSKAAALVNSYLARRGSGGWSTHGLLPPQLPGKGAKLPGSFQYYSPDLGYALIRMPRNGSLAPGDNPNAENLYLRDNLTDTFHTLSLESSLGVAGSDPSTPRVFFDSEKALLPGAVEGSASRNVYEWDDGQIQLASIRPDGTPFPGGASLETLLGRYSDFAVLKETGDTVGGTAQLYLRKNHQTVKVSVSQRTTPDPSGPGFVEFEGASDDGSKIFFTSTEALTDDADAQLGGPKLYRYDATTNTVTDLTASAIGREIGEAVVAVSADGSYVYFFSRSQFHPGENEKGESSLYLWHNGTITFIGADPRSLNETKYWATTYRISPSGRRLSFTTNSRMTSYDNADSVPGGSGESRQDDEVYIYDADLHRLTCVSCNPSGQRPTGTPGGGLDGGSASPMPPVRQSTNLQPGVTDDGRIFFNSRDALVPEDVNGKRDVYEWEDGRVHLISSGTDGNPSLLASSSATGDDVFISTREQLVVADHDENVDVYDARVGGGFPKAASPSSCEGLEGCHGTAKAAPSFADPASGSLSGAAQLSPSARRLKAARKACKKKPKKARAKCTANAKKHFKAGRAH
jgi:hypothetical protein